MEGVTATPFCLMQYAHCEGQHNREVVGGYPDDQGPQYQEESKDDMAGEGLVPRGVQEVVQGLGAEKKGSAMASIAPRLGNAIHVILACVEEGGG